MTWACELPCAVSAVFLFSMVFMSFGPRFTSPGLFRRFQNALDESQLALYDRIVSERLSLYLGGYGLGLALSAAMIMYNTSLPARRRLTDAPLMCVVGAVTFVTAYFYYILSPKKEWMDPHLNTREQKDQWLNVHKTMQWNYHLSFLLGILAVVSLAKGCNGGKN